MSFKTVRDMKARGGHPQLAYRPEQVGELLGLGRTMVYQLVREGKLHSIKVGRTRLIPAAALDAFLALPSEAA